jgi:hypothetical protein
VFLLSWTMPLMVPMHLGCIRPQQKQMWPTLSLTPPHALHQNLRSHAQEGRASGSPTRWSTPYKLIKQAGKNPTPLEYKQHKCSATYKPNTPRRTGNKMREKYDKIGRIRAPSPGHRPCPRRVPAPPSRRARFPRRAQPPRMVRSPPRRRWSGPDALVPPATPRRAGTPPPPRPPKRGNSSKRVRWPRREYRAARACTKGANPREMSHRRRARAAATRSTPKQPGNPSLPRLHPCAALFSTRKRAFLRGIAGGGQRAPQACRTRDLPRFPRAGLPGRAPGHVPGLQSPRTSAPPRVAWRAASRTRHPRRGRY